jgi:AcrR family transcriptional regulator
MRSLSAGSTRLNTTRVAERAGVSLGTLYQYFPNKQALLLAVLERYLANLMDTLEAACNDHRGATAEVMTDGAVKGLSAEGPICKCRSYVAAAMQLPTRAA